MRWLIHNIHARLMVMLILGFLIGLVWKDEMNKLRGCRLSPPNSSGSLISNISSNALALKPPAESHDIIPSAKDEKKQNVNRRCQQQKHPTQRHYPKGSRLILLNTVMANVLPSHQNEQVKLNAGLTLNYFGNWTNDTVIAYTKNPALGGRRKCPRYFVINRCDVDFQ